jgi:hypothetical protein
MRRLVLVLGLAAVVIGLLGCGGGGDSAVPADGKLPTAVLNPMNAFLSLHIWDNTEPFYPHHYDLGNVAGDPGNPADDGRGLLYPFPTAAIPHSYTTIRVDGADNRFGVDGTYVSGPAYVGGGVYESAMKYASGDIRVTQRFWFEPFDPGVDPRALHIEYEVFHCG